MKILIAEDNLTSRSILEAVLGKWGYEVVSTSDGEEAWKALRSEDAPRLAVVDWEMPKMDGSEVCRKVRQLNTRNPVYIILLTARQQKEDIVAGLDAGANDYITKPFDKSELRARVNVGRRVVELQTALTDRVRELEEAAAHIKTLQGILPICMHCHMIKSDDESWHRIEEYIEGHTEAQFSHALCSECLEKYYPEEDGETEEE